jgi:hypothetical protein
MSTGWVVCRKWQQIDVPNIDVLPRWAERGRIRPDDYLVNLALETCLQAKDIPDLNAIFRKVRMRRLEMVISRCTGILVGASLKAS